MEEEETKSDEESSVNFSKTKTKKRKASNKWSCISRIHA